VLVVQLSSTDEVVESALKTCSLTCREAVALYLSEDDAPGNEFGRRMLQAAAAIDAAAAAIHAGEETRHATFEIAGGICREAAEECRRSGLDPALLRAAAACERAAAVFEGPWLSTPQKSPRLRATHRSGRPLRRGDG
jgi:hypothetical protein